MFYTEYIRLCNSVHKAPTVVAEEIGFNKSNVTRWKQGGMPSAIILCRIADYFGVSVEALMNEHCYCTVQENKEQESDVKREYRCLSERGQAIIDSFIEGLLSEGNIQLIGQMIHGLLEAEKQN